MSDSEPEKLSSKTATVNTFKSSNTADIGSLLTGKKIQVYYMGFFSLLTRDIALKYQKTVSLVLKNFVIKMELST